ncbi:MAG TPA: response regulator [Geobacteraceae bacterium]
MARPKILLVDDSQLFLEKEKEFLQQCAVKIYTARDGQETLDVVRMICPDLVYMDLHMPGMDGDACCAILKADPGLQTVPVVMVVTSDDDADLERCRRAGADHVLTKPVDRTAFIAVGHRFLPGLDHIELRVPCLTLVVFRLGAKAYYGTSANLSTQGIFLAFDGDVELDDRLRLSFHVPGSDGAVVEATGRVAWRNTGIPLCKPVLPRGFGVEFLDIAPDGTHAIAEFMARVAAGGMDPVVEGAYLAESVF